MIMNNYAVLFSKLNQLQKKQSNHFQTTSFWEKATHELVSCIEDQRLKDFRRDKACLSYFVPTYGPPGLGLSDHIFEQICQTKKDLTEKQITTLKNFFNGTTQAISDRRAINACIEVLGFNPFKGLIESSVGNPIEHHNIEGTKISRPMANYMLGLLFVLSHLKSIRVETVVEIGGGYGALGELLFGSNLETNLYINFDIPPTCIFAEFYLKQVLKNNFKSDLSLPWPSQTKIEQLSGAHVRPNWDIQFLEGSPDLFVNFHSFQEMEPDVVRAYLNEINRLKPSYLLLRNIKEGKQKRRRNTAGVISPVKAQDYTDWLDQYELIAADSFTFGNVTADNFHSELTLWGHK